MATLFLDFENGNDNYGGTSFALLAQGTNGRITTATFSSAGASFPNDGSLIGQYLSIFNGTIYAVYNITAWVSSTSLTIAILSGGTALANQAVDRQYYIGGRWKNITTGATAVRTIPGDTIRIMGSPAPTSLGQNGVWTSQALQTTKNLVSSTNATPIAVTVTAHGYSTGDTVVVTGVNGNTNTNGTWEITSTGTNTFTLDGSAGNAAYTSGGTVRLRNNTRVMLTSAVTQNIASTGPGRTAWTSAGGVNVAVSLVSGVAKEFTSHERIDILAGFTTGRAAYWATPATLDLSGYQQVSFWIRQNSGTIGAAGAIDLRLCSDAAGVTAVNTISIPNLAGLSRWTPVTVDLGTNLGSNINSIALYVNTDNGPQDIQLNNIIACKASSAADSLTLTSLIGKNTTGETFWGIQSINGTRVMLDADTNATPTSTSVRGYYGTSGTVTTWKRETIKLGPAASSTTALQAIQESGTDVSPITYSGGWDRTNMSSKSLETWIDGQNGNGYGVSNLDKSYISMENLAAVRFNYGIAQTQSYTAINLNWNLIAGNNCNYGVTAMCSAITLVVNSCVANGQGGVLAEEVASRKNITCLNASSNGASGIRIAPVNGDRLKCVAYNNGSVGIEASGIFGNYFAGGGLFIYNSIIADNQTVGLRINSSSFPLYGQNVEIQDVGEVTLTTSYALYPVAFSSQNHDNVQNNHKIFLIDGLISSATDQRKTASGISWKMQPTSISRNSFWPIPLSLAKVACSANNLVTIKAWMRRDNAGLTMRLVCKGGQIAGVASDVVSALSTTNAWEEETITFTPTETGVVEITAEAWGGTTFSGWVDDMTISQA